VAVSLDVSAPGHADMSTIIVNFLLQVADPCVPLVRSVYPHQLLRDSI
jgi:hypothetical protein